MDSEKREIKWEKWPCGGGHTILRMQTRDGYLLLSDEDGLYIPDDDEDVILGVHLDEVDECVVEMDFKNKAEAEAYIKSELKI